VETDNQPTARRIAKKVQRPDEATATSASTPRESTIRGFQDKNDDTIKNHTPHDIQTRRGVTERHGATSRNESKEEKEVHDHHAIIPTTNKFVRQTQRTEEKGGIEQVAKEELVIFVSR
jgi:hypothetical protein